MSEFHPEGPWGPPKDITDPRYWDEVREMQKRPGSAGLGLIGIPFLIPVLIFVGGVLYPLAALVTLATCGVGWEISRVLGLTGAPMYALTFGPALVVMWFACRWDAWFAQNKIYWWVRHVARNFLLVAAIAYALAGEDAQRGKSGAQILTSFFQSQEVLGVTAVILVIFNVMLIRDNGFVKTIWHAGMELARLRPVGLRG